MASTPACLISSSCSNLDRWPRNLLVSFQPGACDSCSFYSSSTLTNFSSHPPASTALSSSPARHHAEDKPPRNPASRVSLPAPGLDHDKALRGVLGDVLNTAPSARSLLDRRSVRLRQTLLCRPLAARSLIGSIRARNAACSSTSSWTGNLPSRVCRLACGRRSGQKRTCRLSSLTRSGFKRESDCRSTFVR